MDAVTYQVIACRLSGIVQEMQEHVFRTGYSTIIRESQDASCMLMDAVGDVVGEHVVLPLHNACLPEVVAAVRAAFDGSIEPGDAFITNHPYLGGVPHSMDMAVVTPVFCGVRLVAFCGSIAHKSDLGGVVAGTANGNAREIFQEGIQYPPVRFARRGAVVADIEAILRANSRTPDLVLGDIRGQVGVARLGERRLAEVIERYGLEDVLETFGLRQAVTERRIRAVVAGWPDGTFDGETVVDTGDDGDGVRFHVRLEKRGDRIVFDFSGSDDQAADPINIRPPLVRGCIAYALIAMIDPTLPNNGGVARVIETVFRRGSVVDPHFPAPTNTYMPSAQAVTEACIDALASFQPHKRIARTGGYGASTIGGAREDGSRFVQYELAGSAYGGRNGSDGPSGVAVLLSNARSAPIEVIESEFPTRVTRFELIRDSGGPGHFRGGLAAVREAEVLAPSVQLSLRGHGHRWPAPGRGGGAPGRPAGCVVNPQRDDARSYPARFSGVVLQRGDRVRFERGGGGGLGPPAERDFAAVVDDVIDGYVSRDAALAAYGVDAARLDAALTTWQDRSAV